MLAINEDPQRPRLRLVSKRLESLPDEEVMLAYQKGEQRAFDVLVRRYRGPLLNFINRMTGNRELAEEALMEVFLKLHRAADRYQPRARFSTYLYTIAYRQTLTELGRKGNRLKTVSNEVSGDDGPRWREHADTHQRSIEQRLVIDEQVRRLSHELGQLPEAHRAAFLLYYREEMSCAECAEVLGLTRAEVKGRLAYARRLLRERIPNL